MHRITKWTTAAVLAGVGTAGLLAGISGGIGAEQRVTTGLSEAEFGPLSRELDLKNQPWTGIRWKVSVTEARQVAAREQKPIFLVVNTGNCLGWT